MLICLPCLLFATRLAFFDFMHLCMLLYMFMHESMCRPYSNPIELWTLDPNLHFSSQDTPFCLITCLFAFSYAQHALFALMWLSLLMCSLHALPISLVSSFSCLLAYFFCLCMYTYGAWTLGARVRPPRCEQKGQGYKPTKGNDQQTRRLSPSRMVSSLSLPLSLFSKVYVRVPLHVLPFTFFLLLAWTVFPRYDNVCFTFSIPCWAIPLECW